MTGIASTQSIAGRETPAQKPYVPALAGQMPVTPDRITVDDVLKATAEHFGTTPEDLFSRGTAPPLPRQRQVAMYVAHKMIGHALLFIGHHMANRSPTTVFHGVGVIENLLDAGDAEMVAAVEAIMERLSAHARKLLDRITVDQVIKVTAEHFGTTPEVLVSDRKTKSFVHHRQIAMYVAREMTGRSMPCIGRHLDRDHSTVLHGVRAIKGLLDADDAETVAAVDAIKERLSAPAEQIPATPARIKIHHVIKVTAKHFGTTPEDLVSDRTDAPLARHRQVAMYVAREMTGRSLPVIGYYMGNRDDKTILHGARVIERLLGAGDAGTAAAVRAIKERLQVLRGRA